MGDKFPRTGLILETAVATAVRSGGWSVGSAYAVAWAEVESILQDDDVVIIRTRSGDEVRAVLDYSGIVELWMTYLENR